MRIGRVIGKVVFNTAVPQYRGGRWLLVSPCGREELRTPAQVRISKEPSVVVYDDLGGTEGDLIGFTEGGEATRPFPDDMPIDAYNCCLIEKLSLNPQYTSEE